MHIYSSIECLQGGGDNDKQDKTLIEFEQEKDGRPTN